MRAESGSIMKPVADRRVQCDVAFEEVVHWLQTAAGDHLHLRLPKLQRLELERNGDHRCAGHRRQWGALLQGAVHLLLRQDKRNWVDLHKFPMSLCYKGYH